MTDVPSSALEAAPATTLPPPEDEHMNILRDLYDQSTPERRGADRRGAAWQCQRRQCEHAVRRRAAEFRRETADLGLTLVETAALLDLAPRTLQSWVQDYRQGPAPFQVLGRPVLRAPVAERNQVIALIAELGPGVGVPTLQACCPGMARAELADLLQRYRRIWRRRNYEALHVLHWQTPGRVWAMDFAEAPRPIDGLYPYLLAVRDLASGQQLLWLPRATATGAEVRLALASLFALRGAPLVLKTDNGSPFIDDATLALLHSSGVIPLFSPPYWPRYNGAIEAGLGSLKTRTEDHASRHGHPGHWTCDDAAAAREQANATARPKGPSGPTPAQAWAARRPIDADERTLFQETVDHCRAEARSQQHHAEATSALREETSQDGTMPHRAETPQDQRALDRQALRRALEKHGYLLYSRRRIPLPIKRRKCAGIT
jgi:putative transposase